MYDLLVLGLIPGTNLQISFYAWIVLLIIVITIGFFLHKHIMTIIEQNSASEIRTPLHASQLHFRG